MVEKIRKLVNLIKKENGRIALVTHMSPDGDAVGSLTGFYLFLKKVGKDVDAVLKDDVPYFLDFVPGIKEIKKDFDGKYDLIFLLDASGFERTGFKLPPAPLIIRIDHHISGKAYSEYDLIIPEAPSVGSLILKIIREYDEKLLDQDIKIALYTALLTDTASFRHANSFRWAFEDAHYLVSNGLDVTHIASMVFERKHLKTYKLLERALSTLTLDGNIGYIVIRKSFFEEVGANPEEIQGFVSYPLSIIDADVGVRFSEHPENFWRISLRGKGKVNLALVAEELGGGGHFNAAGCRLMGREHEVVQKVLDTIRKYMKKSP